VYIGTIRDGQELASVGKLQTGVRLTIFLFEMERAKGEKCFTRPQISGRPLVQSRAFVPSVTYQGASRWTQLTFDLDRDGKVTGMNLHTADGTNVLVTEKAKE
jgi:hypothetical protein